MRVLMFGWEFPPFQAGGLATATFGLVKGLLRRGVDVTLVVPFPVTAASLPKLRLVSAARALERLRRLRVPSPVVAYGGEEEYLASYRETVGREGKGRAAGGPIYGRNLLEEVERLASVAADIAAVEPHDVIHAHDWITYRAGIRAREVSGKPLILHIHATEFDRSGESVNAEILARERDGLLEADIVISNSHRLKRQVVEAYGIPDAKVEVVHWGLDEGQERWIDGAASPFPARQPVVLFLGRVTRQKGPDYFIEVAARVARLIPSALFVVVGTGDMLPQVIERAAELDLAGRVLFAGPVQGAEVDRSFQMASVCVMPSVSEPFGLVALESMRAGTPCIIPNDSGVAEVVRNAFRVDFWDIDEMTNKIVAILRHPELQQELIERGQAELAAPRFSLDEPARKTEAIYLRALRLRGVD